MTHPQSGATLMSDQGTSSPVSLALAWIAVGVPLAWGVSQTIIKSMALFK